MKQSEKMSDSASSPIEILLEFSHTAVIKEKPVVFKDGVAHTHDWHLQVKAFNGGHCENYLERVVFELHKTFPNPKRHAKAPLFEIRESGYGKGFTVPIDLYFKTTDNHFRKTRVNYNLVLQPSKDAVIPIDPDCERKIKMSRTEKFTFPGSVGEVFRGRLLRGGGKLIDLPLPLGRISHSTSYKESSSKAVGSTDTIINKNTEENFKERKHRKHIKAKKHKRKYSEKHRSIEEKEVKPPEEESEKDIKTLGIMDQVGSEMEVDIKEEGENGRIESRKSSIYVQIQNQENKRPKLETYCLLCQEYGHVLNDDCIVNATCLSCGVKGHIRRDCYCLLCQEYGHVLTEDCTTCFNCGIKGHVHRDCSSLDHFKRGSPMNNNRKRPRPSFESSPSLKDGPSTKRWCRDTS